ncbi:MAG: leucine-rich repeat protein, partial [Clostridia bacterium]|nr:leucine-rich repeat protein [Clostridia bacterium]
MKKLLQTALSLILILTMIVPMLVLPMQAETPITNASVEEPSTYAALAEGAPTGIANTESGYTASGYTDIDEGDGYVQIGTKTQADATVGENYIPKLYYFDNANAYYNATEKKLVWVATNTTLTAASDNSVADGKNQNVAGAVWYLAYWAEQNQADILEVEFRAGTKGTTLYYIGCFTRLSSTVSVKIDSNFKIILGNDGFSSHGIFNNMPALRSAGHGEFASDGKFTATTYAENTVDVTGFTDYEDTYFAYSFYKCNAITKIITPVITGEKMFDRCKKVTQITVTEGATITAIGANTFKDCLVLEKIKINGIIDPAITIDSTAFTNVPDTVTVIVNTAAEKGYFENALTTAGITGVTVSSVESDTPVEADNAIKSEGFSVRMKSYTGLRALFSFDLDVASANQDKGLTLISYGAIASSYNRFVNEFNSDEDALFAQARKNTNSVVKYIPVYNADGSGANRYVDYESRTFCISLTHISSANALSDIYMAGYAIWVDANGNESYTLTSYNMADGEKAVNLYEI